MCHHHQRTFSHTSSTTDSVNPIITSHPPRVPESVEQLALYSFYGTSLLGRGLRLRRAHRLQVMRGNPCEILSLPLLWFLLEEREYLFPDTDADAGEARQVSALDTPTGMAVRVPWTIGGGRARYKDRGARQYCNGTGTAAQVALMIYVDGELMSWHGEQPNLAAEGTRMTILVRLGRDVAILWFDQEKCFGLASWDDVGL